MTRRNHASFIALFPKLVSFAALVLLSACSGGSDEESADITGGDQSSVAALVADAGMPGKVAVQLAGTLTFSSRESLREGTSKEGMSYTRDFNAHCNFTQPASMWTNSETGALEFSLTEVEPGVVKSVVNGKAEATGDSLLLDLKHEPPLKVASTVRLRGPVTHCLIRSLESAQLGGGHDMYLEFEVVMNGTAQTNTQEKGSQSTTATAGFALPLVLVEPHDPSAQDAHYQLVNAPDNIGMHLHASPLLLQPALGSRPTGDDPEVKASQQIYDGLVAHPQTAWLGLKFDPARKLWTFDGKRTTNAGAHHALKVRIEVIPTKTR